MGCHDSPRPQTRGLWWDQTRLPDSHQDELLLAGTSDLGRNRVWETHLSSSANFKKRCHNPNIDPVSLPSLCNLTITHACITYLYICMCVHKYSLLHNLSLSLSAPLPPRPSAAYVHTLGSRRSGDFVWQV